MLVPLLFLAVVVGTIFYVIATYNSFQTLKTRIEASIQEIGNQLKRQASLIPNLEETVKGYLKQEKDIFMMLTEARKAVQAAVESGGGAKVDTAVQQLNALLPQLKIVVEDNPELKSNEVVQKLMEELRDTSDKLMYARRTLIDLAADYNVKLVTFPSNLVGKMFGFQKAAGLATPQDGSHTSVSAEEMEDVKVTLTE